MSKKLFLLLIAVFLLMGGLPLVYAEAPASQNVEYLSGSGGSAGVTPFTEVVRVRYGLQGVGLSDASLASGDIVVWDSNSADGITVSACIVDYAMSYAGVMVTTAATADSSTINPGTKNWGYMAVRGYALAKVDTSDATVNGQLITNGGTLIKSFGTVDSVGNPNVGNGLVSKDIGVLLSDTGTDGLMPVMLR